MRELRLNVTIQTIEEYLQLADWKFELSLDEGRHGDFYWLRSKQLFGDDLLGIIDLPKKPFQVVLTFWDGQGGAALSFGDEPGWRKLGPYAISERSTVLPKLSFEADNEQLIIVEPISDQELIAELEHLDLSFHHKELEVDKSQRFLAAMETIKPYCYFSRNVVSDGFFFVTRNSVLYRQFRDNIPVAEIESNERKYLMSSREQLWNNLGPECGPDVCIEGNCDRLRIMLAVRCFIHQLQWGDRH